MFTILLAIIYLGFISLGLPDTLRKKLNLSDALVTIPKLGYRLEKR